jgi:hypothetical protein
MYFSKYIFLQSTMLFTWKEVGKSIILSNYIEMTH